MSEVRASFYTKSIIQTIPKDARILVCGAGPCDLGVFKAAGYQNVVMSNLDVRQTPEDFLPYLYCRLDLNGLAISEQSFDYVVTNACLHHCPSPHAALLEMYRVASKGVLVIESRDSFLMRLLEKIGITEQYEVSAVYYSDKKFGGVNNTNIPNFIYRWTEREVKKTISTYDPTHPHKISFFYGSSIPAYCYFEKRDLKNYMIVLLKPFYLIFAKLFKRQQNQFAFFIDKTHAPHFPWLKKTNGTYEFIGKA